MDPEYDLLLKELGNIKDSLDAMISDADAILGADRHRPYCTRKGESHEAGPGDDSRPLS